ncbi:hypothetical protein C922_03953 [Plasmodium inui San Antonio 1]|uniref:Uncharacterized protein n=1 Tax=Plasmodium inui San Antonio 1 TaxID=1237626 RepID=W7A212_9APIC|nr:hypothetical protein C922_03953 [Plasmodium inui San Antonio 1]EUD65705.1 hypothetical protein C922_03953 [Plasmodium inui San Antonio 1]
MNFLTIFQSKNKGNSELVSPPNGEVPNENDTSSPPVTNEIGLNYSHGVNTEQRSTNISPPVQNWEQVNMGGIHVDGSVRQANFENAANGLIAHPGDPGETRPSASSIHPVGVHSVGVHSVGVPPPQFGGPSIYEEKENYDYPNGSLGTGLPYPDGELYAHLKKRSSDASYPYGTYDMSSNDTYGGGTHGRRARDKINGNNSGPNNRGSHPSQYITNHGVVPNVNYVHPAEKNIGNVAKQTYYVNSAPSGGEAFQSPTDLPMNNAKGNVSLFESKTGRTYVDPKSNYAEQVERRNSYNNNHIVGAPYTGSTSVGTLPYGYDQHVTSNNATNGMVSPPGGMDKHADYAFPSGAFPTGEVTEHNLSNNLVHSFQHQLNDIPFTQQRQVTSRKKGDFTTNQSYLNLYGAVGGANKMAATNPVSNYSYEEDLLSKHPNRVESGVQVGTTQMGSARKLVQGGHVVSSAQVISQQVSSQQVSSQQVSGQQVSGQQMRRPQMSPPQMDEHPNGAEFYGKGFPPNGAPNGQLRMGKAEQKRKQQVEVPRRSVREEKRHNKGIDSVGKMVRWKENEEEDQPNGKKVDATVEVEDDKGNEYYYQKTMEFMRKEFTFNLTDDRDSYPSNIDILSKTPFCKLINFEKKLAAERKRVLNYYHEDRKQIYSSSTNKDKQFSHIFLNNEKYYDAKEILAYLLPYHTFYLEDIYIDSSDDDKEFCENLQNDVREIDAGISEVKDSFRAYTNPSMLWSFNKIIDRTDDQHNKRKKVSD